MQSSALSVIENMADIIAYAHSKQLPDGGFKQVLTLRSMDNSVRCGCRFKYIEPEIDFSYDALTKALNAAIDKESSETNGQFVTNERNEVAAAPEYNYDSLMEEFQTLAGKLTTAENAASNSVKITAIIEKYLGRGKKISETTPHQAEFVYLIVSEIKAELM